MAYFYPDRILEVEISFIVQSEQSHNSGHSQFQKELSIARMGKCLENTDQKLSEKQ